MNIITPQQPALFDRPLDQFDGTNIGIIKTITNNRKKMITNLLTGNEFIKSYKTQMNSTLKRIYPSLTDEFLDKYINTQLALRFKDIIGTFENTYRKTSKNMTASELIDWFLTEKPIPATNGAFFKRHEQELSNITPMIIRDVQDRKKIKGRMFKKRENGDFEGYLADNLLQNNIKIGINSIYGALGSYLSILYNESLASGITSIGRSVIATTMWTLERFAGNNIIFDTYDDLLLYVDKVLQDIDRNDVILDESYMNYDNLPDDKHIIKSLMSKIRKSDQNMDKMYERARRLYLMLSRCDNRAKALLYYRNNLIEFCRRNNRVESILMDLVSLEDTFHNPYEPSNNILPYLNTFKSLVTTWVFHNHMQYDRIKMYINDLRRIVVGSDTDSVFGQFQQWHDYVIDVAKQRGLVTDRNTTFKTVNFIANTITDVIHLAYAKYCSNNNISKEWHKYLKIKNEFYYERMQWWPSTKKNYLFLESINEGQLIDPPQFGAKGKNMNSSSDNPYVTAALNKIASEELILTPSEEISHSRILSRLFELRQEIEDSLKAGESKFGAPKGVKASYDDPMRIAQYKAAMVYNSTAEIEDRYPLPASINIINVKFAASDVENIRSKFPIIADRLEKHIFNSPDKRTKEVFNRQGIKAIAIPQNDEVKIPEWIVPYINIDDIVKKFLAPLTSLLPAIHLNTDVMGSQNVLTSNTLPIT